MLGPIIDALFPARCLGCGAAGALCPACLVRARPAPGPTASPPPGLDWWVAAFAYEGPVREALARVKYRNARFALPVLAAALVGRLRDHDVAAGPGLDVVTWPSTTPRRRRSRGFDQAELLARLVGRGLGLPVRRCLVRREGPSQTGRSARERRTGPVFEARGAAGLRVLVVDDVATTGATLAAAARALRSGGARAVAAATVARTPRRVEPRAGPGRSDPRSARMSPGGEPEGCGSVARPSSRPAAAPLPTSSRDPTSGRGRPREEPKARHGPLPR